MRTFTFRQLKGACRDQRALFKSLFGGSVEITEALCVEHANKFDWSWAAAHLLSASALTEYDRVCAPALTEYDRVCAPALTEYDRVRASAWAEYDRVCASAWAEYDRVCASAWAEYDRVRASAFARAYINDQETAA